MSKVIEIYPDYAQESQPYSDTTFTFSKAAKEAGATTATFQKCQFTHCQFVGLNLNYGAFEDCEFSSDCRFIGCTLMNCSFRGASLDRCRFDNCDLISSDIVCRLSLVAVDEGTKIDACLFDKYLTDIMSFRQVRRAQRRSRWRTVVESNPWLGVWIRIFWSFSDYGTSTARLIFAYALSVLFFQQAYLLPTWFDGEPLLHINGDSTEISQLHALYFAVITSTTVGYGDVIPRSDLPGALRLVIAQVGFSYLLLTAALARITSLVQE